MWILKELHLFVVFGLNPLNEIWCTRAKFHRKYEEAPEIKFPLPFGMSNYTESFILITNHSACTSSKNLGSQIESSKSKASNRIHRSNSLGHIHSNIHLWTLLQLFNINRTSIELDKEAAIYSSSRKQLLQLILEKHLSSSRLQF